MKSPGQFLLGAALGVAFSVGALARAADQPTPPPTAPAPAPDLKPTCPYMLVPHPTLPAAKALRTTARCTPEMMKHDPRCQLACRR